MSGEENYTGRFSLEDRLLEHALSWGDRKPVWWKPKQKRNKPHPNDVESGGKRLGRIMATEMRERYFVLIHHAEKQKALGLYCPEKPKASV